MVDVQIPSLPAASAVADSDLLIVQQGSTTRRATRSQVIAGIAAGVSDSVSGASFGLNGDGNYSITGGSMTSGSAVLTGAGFTSAMVGAIVRVKGAGASGASLSTTVSSFQSSTQVTLAASAGTSIANTSYVLGHDNTNAIQTGLNNAAGKRVTLPAGTYFVSSNVQIPSNTTVDLTGVTILYGGFAHGDATDILFGTFVGAGDGSYQAFIFCPTGASGDCQTVGNKFINGNWGILRNEAVVSDYLSRWVIEDNFFNRMQAGGTHIAQMLDSEFSHNVSQSIKTGSNTFEFIGTQQRNTVEKNTVNGGRAGIIFLWQYGRVLAPTATQGWDCWGNEIRGNRVMGQTEEGISFDSASNGSNTFDNASVASVSTTAKTVTLSGSAWSTAGSKWQYSYLHVFSGNGIGQTHKITAMSNATLTLGEADATDLGKIAAGDMIVIGAPYRDNVIDDNFVDGRNSTTFSIYLYTFCTRNIVKGNTTQGAPIGTGSTNSMAAVTGSITGGLTAAPASNNIFSNNICSGAPLVAPGYFNAKAGIHLLYLNYGGNADFYTVGNLLSGNIVRGGQITLQRNEQLDIGNVYDRPIVATNPPPSGTVLNFPNAPAATGAGSVSAVDNGDYVTLSGSGVTDNGNYATASGSNVTDNGDFATITY
jgi:hypothetical protein